MAVKRQDIGSKRENKIKVSVKDVEQLISDIMIKYDIDATIEQFVNNKLDNCLNEKLIVRNSELKNKKNYINQFDNALFNEIYNFICPLLEDKCTIELDLVLKQYGEESEEYEKLKLVVDNIFETIDLTMYKEGVHKIKLVAYHYLTKCLEIKADIIIKNNNIKNIRGYKTSIELFSYELIEIIATNPDIEKFTLTLRSVIEQWIIKYNNKSKIGQFYYSILMINADQIIEKILRYLLFTAIKNYNPIYLRAIFSTYITLIHKNIFSFYALKLSNVKVGYFKQLESLFEDEVISNVNRVNVSHQLIHSQVLNQLMCNKRFLRHNFEFLMDDYSTSFLDINYFDFLYGYRNNLNVMDYHFYYSKYLKLTKNSFRSQSNYYKINSNFYKPTSKKILKTYINEMIHKEFYKHFLEIFKDHETATSICESIGQNLLKKINQNNFCSNKFNKILMNFDEYLEQLSQVITNIHKLI